MNGLTTIPPQFIFMFNLDIVQEVWEKAIPVMNQNPNHVCKDECGAWIVFDAKNGRYPPTQNGDIRSLFLTLLS
jgi:hypothetical protein